MKRFTAGLALATALLMTGCTVQVNTSGLSIDNCTYSSDFVETQAVDGATRLEVNAISGSLTIRGQEGLTEVRAEGRACASSENLLQKMSLESSRSGETVRVDVGFPNAVVAGNYWMDLTIDLPADMTARVDASSGAVVIERLAGLELTKGSGDLDITEITGDLRVQTGSGTATLREIEGATTYEGGSGDLTMRDLKGKVTVREKGSGKVMIENLGSDLVLHDVGSGDIDVLGIAGALEIGQKMSGRFRFSDLGSFTADELGSGDLEIRDVKGPVTLHEKSSGTSRITGAGGDAALGSVGSGSLVVERVSGNLTVRQKFSGSVTITDITKSVRLDDVGSGTLRVERVKGDLTVRAKGSGDIDHAQIEGRVEIPSR